MSQSCMYRVGIKALIHNEQGNLLLTWEDRKGLRDLPGGGLEPGTSIADGLLKEIYEELGKNIGHVVIDPQVVCARPCMFDDGFGLFLVAYKVQLDITQIAVSDENQKRGFFSKQEVKNMKLYTQVQDIDAMFG